MFIAAFKQKQLLTITGAVLLGCFFTNSIAYGQLRIMPLGDSITKGVGSSFYNGYRKPLYQKLINDGYVVDFVGTQTDGDFPDPYHEGHGSYYAKDPIYSDIYDNIYNWLVANPPDIVLLHIGTNDIAHYGEDANEISDILDEIDRYEYDYDTQVIVYVARIITLGGFAGKVTNFNNNVQAMVMDRINDPGNPAYPDLIIPPNSVDMESALDYPADYYDLAHPNDGGYAKMADVWYNALVDSFTNAKTLTISSTTGGSVTAPGEGDFFFFNDPNATISATADLYHQFDVWTGTAVDAGKVADPCAANTTVLVDANYTVVANFEQSALYTKSYEDEVEEDNPIIWIRFDSDTAMDYSGNDNIVMYGGNVRLKQKAGGIGLTAIQDSNAERNGTFAAAVTKHGQTMGYGEHGPQYSLIDGNDMTIEFWYKSLPPDGDNQASAYSVMCHQIGPYTNEPNAPCIGTSDGQIRIFGGVPDEPGVPGSNIFYTGKYPYDQEWHQIVVIYQQEYQGQPNTMNMKLYFDGGPLGGAGQSGAIEKTVTGPGAGFATDVLLNHMMLGAYNDRGWPYASVPGYYDEWAIYDYPLDADRILDHWTAWQPKTCKDVVERGLVYVGDINEDCRIDFFDFAEFALDWALCNDPGDTNCLPNW